MALMFSGIMDAMIGGVLLLIGFGLLPVDVTQYGIANWIVNVLGGGMFLFGMGTFAYNLSRMNE